MGWLSRAAFVGTLAGAMFGAGCTVGEPRRPPTTGFDAEVDAGTPDAASDAGPSCGEGSTVGAPCASNAQCDDGCFCNGVERCVEGACVAGTDPCRDTVDCTVDGCDEMLGACVFTPDDTTCSDGDACNGAEVCDPRVGGCRSASPLYCNDEDSCTVDSCDTATGCVFEPRDLDGDGYRDARCGGEDCDDDPRFGTMINPGADEVCDNRRDDDCDGSRDYYDLDCTPTNDACASATVLPGAGTFSGATRGLTSTTNLGCSSSTTAADAFFTFTLAEPQDVWITAAGSTTTTVALREAANCERGPELACVSGSPSTLLRRSLPAGQHFVVVESSSATVFDLTLRFEPPTAVPPVDRCDGSTLDISAGGTFTGLFAETNDDYTLLCNSTARPDAAYRLVLDAPKDVVLEATTSGGGSPSTSLALVANCSDRDTTLRCQSNGRPGRVVYRDLPAGTYYVLLESSSTTASMWSLTATITDPGPRPPGDACSSAVDITAGPGTASLGTAERDVTTSCGGTSSLLRDLVFTFELTSTRDVRVTTNGAGYHGAALQTECGVVSSELRCRQASSPQVQSWRSLPAGRYWVVVDTTLSSGNVTASVETSDPTPVPPNDRCDGAIPLSGSVARRDTLTGFEDDVSACGGTNPDAFYEIRLATRREILVSVRPADDRTHSHNLSLRDGCAATASLVCDTGNPAVINRVLDPGTYVLVVEAGSSVASDFELRFASFPAP
ncbi:MAG: hypothetical protein H6720_12260 [Sandaracinus sp.]|nr:hypothetical protein [Sandaracinus sp.]